MNKTIEQFARQTILRGLVQCSVEQQNVFKLMHVPPFDPRKRTPEVVAAIKAKPIEEAVAAVPTTHLDWALTQIENTLRKVHD